MKQSKRGLEIFSLSFLDCICCGFGALILVFVLSKFGAPVVMEEIREDLEGKILQLEQTLHEIRGETAVLNRQLKSKEEQLSDQFCPFSSRRIPAGLPPRAHLRLASARLHRGVCEKRGAGYNPAMMKTTRLLSTALLLAAMVAALEWPLTAQTGIPTETPAQRDARMEWWREARFGMFVHWGLYSGLAGTWEGKAVATRGGMEWIQNSVKADTDTYARAAIPRFRPKPGFAREWARLAKDAGCRYLVFTTKHHEGFALHDSKASDYDAGSVLHRDLVKEIVQATRAERLRVGFYHSVIDWHHDQYAYALSKQLPHPLKGKPYPNGERDHTKYQAFLRQQGPARPAGLPGRHRACRGLSRLAAGRLHHRRDAARERRHVHDLKGKSDQLDPTGPLN